MLNGSTTARHYATGQPIRVQWENGLITGVEPWQGELPDDIWIAPALVDLQVNGYAGVDFQSEGLTSAELLKAVDGLRADGCTRFLLTLITDEWPKLISRLRHLRSTRKENATLRNAIAGWHIEGPFLSPEPGYHGAHNPAVMLDPTPDHVRELRAAASDDPLLLTLAPERAGAIEAIGLAASIGIAVSLGHTNASFEVLNQAVRAGATGFTHLGNACPQQLDRHDNILWRALDTPGLTVGLIADRIHVSPSLFRLIHRALGHESIYYTTDAMSAAGAPPGRYRVGNLELEVGADQIVRQPGRTNFAGSALSPIQGVFRAAEMLDRPWQEVWDAFSSRPANFMHLPTGIAVGHSAHFCLLTVRAARLIDLRVYAPGSMQS